MDEDRWEEGRSVLGLPKVGHRNVKLGKKTKKKQEGDEKEEDTKKKK
jgi:hypothetical protein